MSTTVHIPEGLLERVDARARARGMSRNRVILEAIEASLGLGDAWPPELVGMLGAPLEAEAAELLEESLGDVRAQRRSRRAPAARLAKRKS